MGKLKNNWQEVKGVLRLFGKNITTARRKYRDFVFKGIGEGRREDLTGGGLVRSAGGWQNVKTMRRAKEWQKSDERILGDGDFVEEALSASQEGFEHKYSLKSRGYDLDKVADRVCELLRINQSEIWAPGKERYRIRARSLLCFWASRDLKISQSSLGRKLRLSATTISRCVKRGEKIARDNQFSLLDD